MSRLRFQVLDAKQRLAEGHEQLKLRHQAGGRGREVCAAAADLRDEVLLGLYRAAIESLGPDEAARVPDEIALVAHGGYGRREVSPYSDVDLMILSEPGSNHTAGLLAERLLCDVFDTGLVLGHSVRTIGEACGLACQDATICSSLIESRFLAGSEGLFRRFIERFRDRVRRRSAALIRAIDEARQEERAKFGETVYLLEPNLKRSRGGLRELQLVRWIGLVRYGSQEPAELCQQGLLEQDDLEQLVQANEFLLWLRNELHFEAGKPGDVLTRAEQVRIASVLGYQPAAGMLPVEQFMRDYFRHTVQVSHLAARFLAKARSPARWKKFWATVLGRRMPGGFRVSPSEILAGPAALRRMRGNLAAIVQMAELASLYEKQIATETWEAIRREAARLPAEEPPSPEAVQNFLSLLAHPGRIGDALRGLHEAGLLERFIPEFVHARGLLQFNQYHKYTVDEHCFRAVEWATELAVDQGPLGRVYRSISRKRILHLALLIHDLGKGHPEDHADVGLRIAEATSRRLNLAEDESEILKFIVHRHLVMNHVALRRDTSEEQTVVRFAVEVGSPELLQMLYVFTAADLGAVGPGTWTTWKAEVLTDLFHQAMQHLAGESPGSSREEYLEGLREAVRDELGPDHHDPRIEQQIAGLPASYLTAGPPTQIVHDLRLLARLARGEVNAQGRYQPETHTVQYTVGTSDDVTPGIFHKLTGALSSQGLEILSAQIYTLADQKVLDRFWVYDPDFAGQPSPQRLEQVSQALIQSLLGDGKPPTFRRIWSVGASPWPAVARAKTRVHIDNSTSHRYTTVDIFTHDRRGLLYAITRMLFELGYSVWRAKIGTYLDQVVDVFYVTDQAGKKVEDPVRLAELRQRLVEAVEAIEE